MTTENKTRAQLQAESQLDSFRNWLDMYTSTDSEGKLQDSPLGQYRSCSLNPDARVYLSIDVANSELFKAVNAPPHSAIFYHPYLNGSSAVIFITWTGDSFIVVTGARHFYLNTIEDMVNTINPSGSFNIRQHTFDAFPNLYCSLSKTFRILGEGSLK